MIKISSRVESSKVSKTQLKKSDAEVDFSDFLVSDLEKEQEISQAKTIGLLSSLSVLQGGSYAEADFAAQEKGRAILKDLDELRRDILQCKVSNESLLKIKNSLANQVWLNVSAELKEVLQEIEQRASVELAKKSAQR
jgi:hypothetical protein